MIIHERVPQGVPATIKTNRICIIMDYHKHQIKRWFLAKVVSWMTMKWKPQILLWVPKSKKLLQFTFDDGTGTDRTILSGIHAYYEPEELVGKTLIAITNLPPRAMMGIESCGMLLSAVNNLKDSEDEELHLLMVDDRIPAGAKLY